MDNEEKIAVFIVDDDPVYTRLLEMYFFKKGKFRVHTFHTGEDCLAHLHLQPKIVILDYHLNSKAGLNGKEVWVRLKESSSPPRVIMMSAQDEGKVVLELIKLGIRDYVIKEPGAMNNLDEAINEYLSSGK